MKFMTECKQEEATHVAIYGPAYGSPIILAYMGQIIPQEGDLIKARGGFHSPVDKVVFVKEVGEEDE